MKVWLVSGLISISFLSYSQVFVTCDYYQDSIRFSGKKAAYDASDVLNTWSNFIRITADFPLGQNYRMNAWVDLNDLFIPKNGRIGVRRNFGQYFSLEGLVKYLEYWIPYLDEMPFEDTYDYYYNLLGVGLAPAFDVQLGIVSFHASLEYTRALTGKQQIYYPGTGDYNFRSLDYYEFKLRNYQSLYLNSGLALDPIKAKSFSLGLYYRFVFRNDYFQFDNQHERYEWTYDNLVESGNNRFKQSSHGFQHHIGLRLTLAKAD